MKERIPIALEKGGEVVNIFPSIHKASRDLGLHVSTIKWRIERGTEVKGVLLRTVTDTEKEKLCKTTVQLINQVRQKKQQSEKPQKIKLKGEVKKSGKIGRRETTRTEADDIELNSEKYSIVSYELVFGRLCITPCPYREAPKPKVGSGLCMDCPSFRGRNRTKQQVACSAVNVRILAKMKSLEK